MYYIGLDVHKKTISYCVKGAAGCVHQEGRIGPAFRNFRGGGPRNGLPARLNVPVAGYWFSIGPQSVGSGAFYIRRIPSALRSFA
jgi:hypothetical protein